MRGRTLLDVFCDSEDDVDETLHSSDVRIRFDRATVKGEDITASNPFAPVLYVLFAYYISCIHCCYCFLISLMVIWFGCQTQTRNSLSVSKFTGTYPRGAIFVLYAVNGRGRQ